MKLIRTLSLPKLIVLAVAVVAAAVGGTALAIAARGSGPTPPAKPLAQAIHDSLTVDGQTVNANISHQATHTGTRLEFSAGFQVDLNAVSTPYHVYVDNLKATVVD